MMDAQEAIQTIKNQIIGENNYMDMCKKSRDQSDNSLEKGVKQAEIDGCKWRLKGLVEVKSFIKSQNDRLSDLEETCPDCGDGQVFGGIPTGGTEKCPTCQGSGKVPIFFFPAWLFHEMKDSPASIHIDFQDAFLVTDEKMLGEFTKPVNGRSKLIKNIIMQSKEKKHE